MTAMGLFRGIVYSALLDRLLRGRGGHGGAVDPRRYGPRSGPGYGRPPQRRGGFGFSGPFPTYSGTTRRGTQVRASGCCLPIPLSVVLAGTAAGLLHRRHASGA